MSKEIELSKHQAHQNLIVDKEKALLISVEASKNYMQERHRKTLEKNQQITQVNQHGLKGVAFALIHNLNDRVNCSINYFGFDHEAMIKSVLQKHAKGAKLLDFILNKNHRYKMNIENLSYQKLTKILADMAINSLNRLDDAIINFTSTNKFLTEEEKTILIDFVDLTRDEDFKLNMPDRNIMLFLLALKGHPNEEQIFNTIFDHKNQDLKHKKQKQNKHIKSLIKNIEEHKKNYTDRIKKFLKKLMFNSGGFEQPQLFLTKDLYQAILEQAEKNNNFNPVLATSWAHLPEDSKAILKFIAYQDEESLASNKKVFKNNKIKATDLFHVFNGVLRSFQNVCIDIRHEDPVVMTRPQQIIGEIE